MSIANHTVAGVAPSTREEDPYFDDRGVLAIFRWIESHSSRPESGESKLRWGQLATILKRHGCEIEHGRGNKRKVRRGALSVTTGARNDGDEIDRREITRIRRALQLDADAGYDSGVFYSGGDPHPDLGAIVQRYRGVLQRLALVDRTI